MTMLTLISHHLCPYAQRSAIALTEKEVPFERIYVDLSNKPTWFKAISPLGKVPVLKVADGNTETVLFESAVILEYLEETQPNALHPSDPLIRAEHRAWIEFSSQILKDIGQFYSTPEKQTFDQKVEMLAARFDRLEHRLIAAPFFDGEDFSLVDTVFGPVFRYFDVFDRIDNFSILSDKPKLEIWRSTLSQRSSIIGAVEPSYPARLLDFLKGHQSHLSHLIMRQNL